MIKAFIKFGLLFIAVIAAIVITITQDNIAYKFFIQLLTLFLLTIFFLEHTKKNKGVK